MNAVPLTPLNGPDQMKTIIDNCVAIINRQNSTLFIFLILCFNFLSFELNSNEEMYLALAKQFFEPQWIPNSFSLTEFPGTRLIFQVITGFFLQYFSFEQVTFAGRLLNFLLFAFALSRLKHLFQLNNVAFFFILQVIYFPHQTFFADEWIFMGFEAKTLSYFFLFYSLYFLIKSDFRKSVFFTIIATYFHILVGGWFFILTLLYAFFSKELSIKTQLQNAGLYVLLCLPFGAYLAQEILVKTATEINGVNLNWIYVYFRAPHHVGLFNDLIVFFKEHLPGIFLSLAFFIICVSYGRKLADPVIRKLNRLNIIIFSMIFVSLIIGYFDKTGFFLKYYPFRISALSMLLIVFQFSLVVKSFIKSEFLPAIYGSILIIAIPVFVFASALNIYIMAAPKDKFLNEMTAFVKKHTQPSEKFVFINYEKDIDHISFFRKAERERFVVYKFVPSGGNKLYEWYSRILEKEKIEQDTDYLFEVKEQHQLDYLVSPTPISHAGLQAVFENAAYHVYQIK